jgi:methionyl aminopeptidase
MRESGKILGYVLSELEHAITPGIKTIELDQIAERLIKEKGGIPTFKGYRGFPGSICICINEEVVHGIPGNRVIQTGDIVTIDCGVTFNSFITDSAITVGVGPIEPAQQKLINTTQKALDNAIKTAKAGIRTTELSKIIEKTVRKQGYGIVEDLSGHGVGKNLHEDPLILNFYDGEPGPILQPGMTIAIEPIISMNSSKTKTLSDKWTIVTKDNSLAVQIEHTIAITEKGAEILTIRPR